MSPRGRSFPANASGFDTHRDSTYLLELLGRGEVGVQRRLLRLRHRGRVHRVGGCTHQPSAGRRALNRSGQAQMFPRQIPVQTSHTKRSAAHSGQAQKFPRLTPVTAAAQQAGRSGRRHHGVLGGGACVAACTASQYAPPLGVTTATRCRSFRLASRLGEPPAPHRRRRQRRRGRHSSGVCPLILIT
jgi:hypothetical protein